MNNDIREGHAQMIEAFAEKIGRFWSPLALDMANNAEFAKALHAGAAALRLPFKQIEDYYIFTDEWGGVWELQVVKNPLIKFPFIISYLEARK